MTVGLSNPRINGPSDYRYITQCSRHSVTVPNFYRYCWYTATFKSRFRFLLGTRIVKYTRTVVRENQQTTVETAVTPTLTQQERLNTPPIDKSWLLQGTATSKRYIYNTTTQQLPQVKSCRGARLLSTAVNMPVKELKKIVNIDAVMILKKLGDSLCGRPIGRITRLARPSVRPSVPCW